MQFQDFIVPGAVIGDLVSRSKNEAIAEMADALIESRAISRDLRQGVLAALLDREKLGSTGIGQGIAIPHAKHPGVRKLVGAFARSREGVDFAACDGQPVHLFFLLLSNQECASEHLEALAHISKHLCEEFFQRFLLTARDEREIRELLNEADRNG